MVAWASWRTQRLQFVLSLEATYSRRLPSLTVLRPTSSFAVYHGGFFAVKYAAIGPIAVHLPERVETNDQLAAEFPDWKLDLIYSKTGIRSRHIAAPDECASDLAAAAAEKLFAEHDVDRGTVDFLLLCTQTPDYPLPTTACLLQHRLGSAHDDRRAGLQSWLFRLCVRAGAGGRSDSLGRGETHSAAHGRDLFEIHRRQRPFATHDLWRRSGRDVDRSLGHPVAGVVRLWH